MDVHIAIVKAVIGMMYDLWTRLDIELAHHIYTRGEADGAKKHRRQMKKSLDACHDAIVSLEDLVRREQDKT